LAGLAEEMRMKGDLDAPHSDVRVAGASIHQQPLAARPRRAAIERRAGMDPNGAEGRLEREIAHANIITARRM